MILPLEQMVVSVELAKRMKELGFPQETYFHWLKEAWNGDVKTLAEQKFFIYHFDEWQDSQEPSARLNFAAPTSGEIGELLPDWAYSFRVNKDNAMAYKKQKWHWCEWKDGIPTVYADTEAEARGLMWCYLKERGLI